MLFTSLTYGLFLGVFFAAYWSISARRLQNLLLLLGGYCFYGWWDWRFCALMLFSSAWDFGAAHLLQRNTIPARRRLLLASSIGVNLAILGFFKYWNFFAENLHAVLQTAGWSVSPLTLQVILPVGISFYTFQSISYVVDVYRREVAACESALDYFTFVAFFPQLMAGPIERARHMLPQFGAPRRFDLDRATDGCRQILWGVFKKMAVADNLAPIVERYYGDPAAATGGQLSVATLAFTFQIYCDFSGYSDIALGSARLLGFDLMRNFAAPYFSASPWEFWRRWHISLSTWFRDYVYIPLGGGRVSRGRRAGNLMTTFLVSGLWHGASWNFAVWGGLHGLAVMPSVCLRPSHALGNPPPIGRRRRFFQRLPGIVGTFIFVAATWIVFRSATLSDALLIAKKIAAAPFRGALDALPFGSSEWKGALFAVGLLAAEGWTSASLHPLQMTAWPRIARWTVYAALVWIILLWGTYQSGQFIYFQF